MIIVDTSVWIGHFHRPDPHFEKLLDERLVVLHPFVLGEIAMGNLKNRRSFLLMLRNLNPAQKASDAEVLSMIEDEELYGKGVGFVDVHLMASARLMATRLWTRDRRLAVAAHRCGLAYAH